MREIKFRAWDKERKIMTEVKEIFFDNEFARLEFWEGNVSCYEHKYFDEVETIQYTGLKDKNGQEIYEGDILKDNKSRISKVIWHGSFAGFVYEYVDKSNKVYSNPNNLHLCYMKMEVIGNVYENRNLLQESDIQ